MAEITIENIDIVTQIAESLDLSMLAEKWPDAKYSPEENPLLILHLSQPKIAVMLSSVGRMFFTGSKSMEQAEEITKTIYDKLRSIGVTAHKTPDMAIQNIVASAHLNKHLDLKSLSKKMRSVEYKPKHFPGLIYRMDYPKTVILLFDSGKIVCQGSNTDDVSRAIENVTNELTSYGVT